MLWLDALVANVDRSWRNPNLLIWHGELWLIDHGAALYFHHAWARAGPTPTVRRAPYDASDHVLAPFAGRLVEADEALAPRVDAALLGEVVALVPDEWLAASRGSPTADAVRAAYVEHLLARVTAPRPGCPGAVA